MVDYFLKFLPGLIMLILNLLTTHDLISPPPPFFLNKKVSFGRFLLAICVFFRELSVMHEDYYLPIRISFSHLPWQRRFAQEGKTAPLEREHAGS